MKEIVGLDNNQLLDSRYIVHNKKYLSDILEREKIVTKSYTYSIGTISQGSKGYFSIPIEKMEGYKLISSNIETSLISDSHGLQLTVVSALPTNTTAFINYYAPETTHSSTYIDLILNYVKE